MSTKYIRPNNLLSDRKTSELIKKKKYISEDEYEAKYAFIESLLSDLDLNIEDAESITEEELNQFKTAEKNINDNIEWLMGYIDEIFHNDKFDIDQKKAKIRNYITEKYNLYKFKNINRFIKQKIKEKYIDYENEEEVISDENNNFQYILKKVKNIDRNKIYDNLIYKITSNDSMSIEDDNNNLIISLNTDIIKEEHEINDFKNNNNIFFYNDKVGFKIVSLTETCSKISFRYKTKYSYSSYQYNAIYLYIDGEYYDKYTTNGFWETVSINVIRSEHEFTWVLYSNSDYYSCIDEIKINDLMVIEYGKFKNYNHNIPLGSIPDNNSIYKSDPSIESTPFYNDKNGIKIVSLTETCSKMSFRYKTISTSGYTNYAYVYLYIDGEYHGCYYNSLWAKISDITLEQGRHEFTWVLYNYFYEYDNNTNYSCICIDEISIDDEIITNYNKFTNNSNYELINNNVNYNKYNSSRESTPFYNLMDGVKIVSLTETCSKMSFRYKTGTNLYSQNSICFYIDGEYCNRYNSDNNNSWSSSGDIIVEQGRHEFTWVLYSNDYYSCIDEISIDDEIITDYNKFNNKMINIDTYDRKNKVFLNNKNYTKYNNYKSVSFYHDKIGVKIVSLTETCSKISFRYQGYQSMMYLYIDGKYYDKYYGIPYYNSTSELEWKSIDIAIEQGRHEFTWVFSVFDNDDPVDHIFEYHEVTKYTTKFICIDEIAIDDIIITDYSKFSNTNNNELINKIEYNDYKYNPAIESTPFYNDKNGIKIVSLTETCSKMSFRYKSHGNDNIFYNCIYLYIDGKYYNKYNSNDIWSSTSVTVEQGRHEFTWVLYSVDNIYYSCIDEITIDDEIITDYNKFNNNSNCELINNKVDDIYKYDPSIESTPFYNAASNGIKIVSLTETCSKMSFRYRTEKSSSYNNAIYLYIDGEYYNEYYNEYTSNDSWYSSGDITVEQGEHEFTWVLYSDGYVDQNYFYYAYIDEIAIDDTIITDYSKFSNNSNYELINNKVNDIYKNDPSIESTPFYNDKNGIKIVSLTETCSKMSFKYKNYSNYSYDNAIYLYIDGERKGTYCSKNWNSSGDITVEQGRHEFTWVLYNTYTDYYSCIDEIAIDDTLITNYDKFTNISNHELNLFNYKYNPSIESTPFYNNTDGIKIVSLTETCSKMSFRYKNYYRNYNYDNAIYLYIDGEYYNEYMSDSNWSSSNDILVEQGEHEFTWILYDRYHFSYTCIDEITIDDEIITDYSKFTNNSNYELINNEINNDYKYNPSIESTPFYNSTDCIKIVTLTETCSKISFKYKTEFSSNKIFFYIDGEYKGKLTSFNNNVWYSTDNIIIQQGEHKFTWVLCNSSSYFTCIDEIAIDNVMITDYSKFNNNINYELPLASIPNNNNSYYKYNPSIDSTPFYNATSNIKIVSLIETCNKISFRYKTRRNYSYIYFYIDGKMCNFGGNYNNNWYSSGDIAVEQGEHEFTWVLYDGSTYEACIDEIAINGAIIIDYNKFTNNINYELINEFYKYRPTVESTPFYNSMGGGIKIISLTETCSKMSFKYKIYSNTNCVYLYIDGQYHSYYSNNDDNNWYSRDITVEQGRHEFTWVLYNSKFTYYSCIDEIAIDDVMITDYNKFSNTNNNELNNNYKYKYDSSTVSTPFYNSMGGIKIISLTETCSKMSFKYKINRNYNYESCIYLYIDGKYYGSYRSDNNVWTSTSITIKQGRHEFTWVLYSYSGYYSCIDEIAIDDVMITDYNKFSNNSNYELNNNSIYKYDLYIESTPFYIDTIGIKKVSLTKTCSKMSFRYNVGSSNNNNDIYLYIDGKYYKTYTYIYSEPWSSSGDITVKQGRHEFTWILRTNGSYYSCIDEIAIDDVMITDYNNFTNNSNHELINEFYKYDLSIDSTPFYNDKIGIKMVSLTETCSKMSFRYKSYREGSLNYIYLYIDGKYYDKYYELYNGNSDYWNSSGDITVEQGEHEFTWILCNNRNKPYDFYYSCIDEIAIDGVIITNYDKFTNNSNHELINEIHKYNPAIESTLFYNDTIGIKIVSLTETCSKMSFRYRTNKNYIYNSSNKCYNYIYLFIDGNYYDQYYNYSNDFNIWSSISIIVEQGEHEFTWILCSDINDKNNHYSCIDEITIDDTLITNYDKFTNNSNYELNSLDNIYKDYYIYKYDNIKLFTMDFEYSGDIYLSINNKITHMKSLPNSIKEKYRIFDYRNEINSIKIYSRNKVNINEAFSLDYININIDPNEEIYNFISLNEKIKYNKIYKIDAKYINIKNINENIADGDDEYICLDSNMNIIFSSTLPFILQDFINNKIEKDIIYLLIYSKNKNGYIDNNIEFEKINFVTRFISFSNNENKKMKLFNGDVYQKIKVNNKNNLHNIIDYNIENIEL